MTSPISVTAEGRVRCHRQADAQLRRTEAAKLTLRTEANLALERFEDDP